MVQIERRGQVLAGEFESLFAAVAAYQCAAERVSPDVGGVVAVSSAAERGTELEQLRHKYTQIELRAHWFEKELEAAGTALKVAEGHRREALQLVLLLQGHCPVPEVWLMCRCTGRLGTDGVADVPSLSISQGGEHAGAIKGLLQVCQQPMTTSQLGRQAASMAASQLPLELVERVVT